MKIEDEIKQKKFESYQQKAIINLIFTSNWLSDQMNDVFKNFEITNQQYNVLRILKGKVPETLCVGEVKEVMLDKNPDLTRLCDRLLKKNYIERNFDPKNRRQVRLSITEKGLQLLEIIRPILDEKMDAINLLDSQQAEALSNLLDKMREKTEATTDIIEA